MVGAKQTSNKQADKSFDSSNDFDLDDDDVMEIMASVDVSSCAIYLKYIRKPFIILASKSRNCEVSTS